MLARIAILSGLALSVCVADNFLISSAGGESLFDLKDGRIKSSHHGGGHDTEKAPQEPMRVIVEDVNPNSELGQAVHYVMAEAQKREVAEQKAKIAKKVVKKKPKKKAVKKTEDCAKAAPQEHVMDMSQLPSGEAIKAKEAPVVDDKPKPEAGHGEKAEAKHEAKPAGGHEEKKPEAGHGEKAPAKDEHKPAAGHEEKKSH